MQKFKTFGVCAVIVLCIYLPLAFAGYLQEMHKGVVVKKNAATATPTPTPDCTGALICQNFEGTGYDNSESWSETGTVDEDYTTTPLRGSQSLSITSASNAGTQISITDSMELWGHFRIVTPDGRPASEEYLVRLINTSTTIGSIRIRTTGAVRAAHGTSLVNSATLLDDGALSELHIWWYWKAESVDTAADGILTVWIGTTTNKGDATQYVSNTAGTSHEAVNVYKQAADPASADLIIDQIVVKATEFTTVEN